MVYLKLVVKRDGKTFGNDPFLFFPEGVYFSKVLDF
jgi:hypothetical protein